METERRVMQKRGWVLIQEGIEGGLERVHLSQSFQIRNYKLRAPSGVHPRVETGLNIVIDVSRR